MFLGTAMRKRSVRVERVLRVHILQTIAHRIVDGNKVVSSLGPAGGPVEPSNWGPLLPAALWVLRLKEIDSLSAA